MRYYRMVFLRERVELQPLDKSPMRAELSSVEILLVEGISDLKEYSISVSLLLSHKKRGRKINITVVLRRLRRFKIYYVYHRVELFIFDYLVNDSVRRWVLKCNIEA